MVQAVAKEVHLSLDPLLAQSLDDGGKSPGTSGAAGPRFHVV
jgi:hypothetical protein